MSVRSRSTLRRIGRWRALGVLMVLGAVAGLVVSATSRPVWTATAQSYVSTTGVSAVPDLQQAGDFSQQAGQSYAALAMTPRVLDGVIDDLDLHTTSEALARQVTVEVPADTVVLQIRVSDPSAQRAAAIAGAVQTSLARQVLAVSPSGGTSTTKVTSISRAVVPEQPSSPNVLLDIALGALGGAAVWLGALVILAIRRMRPPSAGAPAPSML